MAPPGVFSGTANVIAVGVLLLEFGMFRQALLRDQVRLYAAQSALISVLAVVVAAARHLPELYVLAGLSFALKVVMVPVVLRRLLRGLGARGEEPGLDGHRRQRRRWAWPPRCCSPSRVAAFGVFSIAALRHAQPGAAGDRAGHPVAVVLVAFVLMIMRRDVASQAIGFFSLENGVSLTALVVAAGLPLILEIAFLFDLLVAVVVFGLLIRVHHGRADSLSTAELTRLRG